MSRYTMRIGVLSVLLISAFLLAGCGEIAMNYELQLREDGSGVLKFKTVFDSVYRELGTESITASTEQLLNDAFDEVKTYTENGKLILEGTASFTSIEDFNSRFSTNSPDQFSFYIDGKRNFFKNTYTLKVRYPENLAEEFKSTPSVSEEDLFPFNEQELANMIMDKISISVSVTMPGKILSHNFETMNGQNLLIKQTLREAAEPQTLVVEAEVINYSNIALAAGSIVLVSIFLALLFRRRSKNPETVSDAQEAVTSQSEGAQEVQDQTPQND